MCLGTWSTYTAFNIGQLKNYEMWAQDVRWCLLSHPSNQLRVVLSRAERVSKKYDKSCVGDELRASQQRTTGKSQLADVSEVIHPINYLIIPQGWSQWVIQYQETSDRRVAAIKWLIVQAYMYTWLRECREVFMGECVAEGESSHWQRGLCGGFRPACMGC